MGHFDHDRPDDSNAPRHKPGSVHEETSATGQRIKGAMKDVAGEIIDDESLEEKGERETPLAKTGRRRKTPCS
jgi:uncharacterized protein YjbJ (UPF0337 family)